MLTRLGKRLRWRAAATMAVLYALCSVAPALALTVADSAKAMHCLTESHHGTKASLSHQHDASHADAGHDGADHQHGAAAGGDESPPAGQCCGIACLTALPVSFADLALYRLTYAISPPLAEDDIAGRTSDLLYRPPIASLSL